MVDSGSVKSNTLAVPRRPPSLTFINNLQMFTWLVFPDFLLFTIRSNAVVGEAVLAEAAACRPLQHHNNFYERQRSRLVEQLMKRFEGKRSPLSKL